MKSSSLQTAEQMALAAEFRAAMRRVTSKVTIVSLTYDDRHFGMTATAVCSLTANPPALLVCVNRSASLAQGLSQGQPFCVNILDQGQAEMARLFGGEAAPHERFQHGSWRFGDACQPYLDDARCNLFCTVDALTEYETHLITVGRVVSLRLAKSEGPLLYGEGIFQVPAT